MCIQVRLSQVSFLKLPKVDMKVIDAAAFVCINAPKCAKTIGDYCMELEEKAFKTVNNVKRADFVFDVTKIIA